MLRIFQNPWTEAVLRWFLGFTFVYSAIHKILFPAHFAKIIYGYMLFPAFTINLIAIILPYLEIISGLCLILGIFSRSAAWIINMMLAGFICAISINLVRGVSFDCGCFAFGEAGHTASAVQLLVRDVLYLAIGTYIMLFTAPRRFALKSAGDS